MSLIVVGTLFLRTEKRRYDARDAAQGMVTNGESLSVKFDTAEATQLGCPK